MNHAVAVTINVVLVRAVGAIRVTVFVFLCDGCVEAVQDKAEIFVRVLLAVAS